MRIPTSSGTQETRHRLTHRCVQLVVKLLGNDGRDCRSHAPRTSALIQYHHLRREPTRTRFVTIEHEAVPLVSESRDKQAAHETVPVIKQISAIRCSAPGFEPALGNSKQAITFTKIVRNLGLRTPRVANHPGTRPRVSKKPTLVSLVSTYAAFDALQRGAIVTRRTFETPSHASNEHRLSNHLPQSRRHLANTCPELHYDWPGRHKHRLNPLRPGFSSHLVGTSQGHADRLQIQRLQSPQLHEINVRSSLDDRVDRSLW